MPTYEYKCDNCDHLFDHYQSMKDDKLTKCPECGKKTLRRLIGTGGGLIFKGSGFYLTDYKNKPSEKSASTPAASSDNKNTESTESVNKETTSGKETKSTDKTNTSSSNSKSENSTNKSGSKETKVNSEK